LCEASRYLIMCFKTSVEEKKLLIFTWSCRDVEIKQKPLQ
jgi:hypothetical protein